VWALDRLGIEIPRPLVVIVAVVSAVMVVVAIVLWLRIAWSWTKERPLVVRPILLITGGMLGVVSLLLILSGALLWDVAPALLNALTKPNPSNFPTIVAALPGRDGPGPYQLTIFNHSKGPFINMRLHIQPSWMINSLFDTTEYKLGDIEIGVTPLTQVPRLPLGYYQLALRYRGGHIDESLLIASVSSQPRQYIWLSDRGKTISQPAGGTPKIPYFAFPSADEIPAQGTRSLARMFKLMRQR
jgi:hypothetical protein